MERNSSLPRHAWRKPAEEPFATSRWRWQSNRPQRRLPEGGICGIVRNQEFSDATLSGTDSLARGLGTQFIVEVDATLKRIAPFLLAHQLSFDDCRRALVHRFPFTIGFRVGTDAVHIDGMFPTQADPSRIVRLLMQQSGGTIDS